MTHIFTESVIEKAMELIQRRNKLVKQLEVVSERIRPLKEATHGILSVGGRNLSVMVTPEVFDLLAQPFIAEIERANEELKALGVVTIDEEMVG